MGLGKSLSAEKIKREITRHYVSLCMEAQHTACGVVVPEN